MKWTKRLSRYTLPGMGLKWDASYFGLLFLAMVLIVLYTFLREYQNALRELYIFRYGTQILRQGAVMPSLNTLIRHKFTVFWAYTALCALRAFANYRSFFTETKSIYLMKRLKDKNELSRRCIAIPAAACGAALLFGGVMALASAGRGGATPLRITLCGVALSGFASAVTAAILILDEQTLLAMRTWLAGDLAGLNWSTLQTALVPALIGLGVALLIALRLNVLALGDKVALGLGVNLVQTRLLGLLAIALLCGAAVAVAGPIGFVGLVVPHVVRRLVTEDIRLALPLAAPVGALALVLADIAARTLVAPQELATGAMTALVGAPLFIFIAARFFK